MGLVAGLRTEIKGNIASGREGIHRDIPGRFGTKYQLTPHHSVTQNSVALWTVSKKVSGIDGNVILRKAAASFLRLSLKIPHVLPLSLR